MATSEWSAPPFDLIPIGDRQFQATVADISLLARVDFNSGWPPVKSFEVKIGFQDTDPRIRPGMSATARIGVGLIWACGLLQVPTLMVMRDPSCASCPDDLLLFAENDVAGDIVGNLQGLCLLAGVAIGGALAAKTAAVEDFGRGGVLAGRIALGVEIVAALLTAIGAVEAVVRLALPRSEFGKTAPFAKQREVFVRFGAWLMLGLEFELAADVIRSAISPSWKEIGQLAAIAAIRTVLNYFLAKDIMEQVEDRRTLAES